MTEFPTSRYAQRWSWAKDETGRPAGWHRYMPPTQQRIKERMVARRRQAAA